MTQHSSLSQSAEYIAAAAAALEMSDTAAVVAAVVAETDPASILHHQCRTM